MVQLLEAQLCLFNDQLVKLNGLGDTLSISDNLILIPLKGHSVRRDEIMSA